MPSEAQLNTNLLYVKFPVAFTDMQLPTIYDC